MFYGNILSMPENFVFPPRNRQKSMNEQNSWLRFSFFLVSRSTYSILLNKALFATSICAMHFKYVQVCEQKMFQLNLCRPLIMCFLLHATTHLINAFINDVNRSKLKKLKIYFSENYTKT